MSRVVLDTNILVSAAIADGKPATILERSENGAFSLVLTPAIVTETDDVLRRDRLPFDNRHVDDYVGKLLATATVVVPSVDVDAVEADSDDNIVLEAALTVGADYIVSGDSHLLELGTFQDVPILTADDFLDHVE